MLQGGELTEAMRLFTVRSDLAFTLLRPVDEDSWPWRGGTPVAEDWRPADLTVAEGAEAAFVAVDCLELISGCDGFILSPYARAKLDDLLGGAGEFWPVSVLGRPYWWFNCLACLEALDRNGTEADWSVVDGDWGSFRWITSTRRLAFEASALGRAPALFRVPEYPQGVLFGTDALAGAVRAHQLTGFHLDCIWSLSNGGVADPAGLGMAGLFESVDGPEIARRRADAIAVLEQRSGGAGRDR